MPAKSPMKVVVCWHMHQPQYRDVITGQYYQPWTYLHATKDYVDMVAHLEEVPEAKAVVNFAPVLLEQIDDYGRQIQGYLHSSHAITDPLLAALAAPVLPNEPEARITLVKACLRANRIRLIDPFPQFKRLAALADYLIANVNALEYLQDQFLVDLLVWYHLAWMGETVRRDNVAIKALIAKERHYTLADRRQLLDIMGELISGVIGRYRSLAEQGRIEVSMTPYAHPIVPLLLDLDSAREAMPDAPMPKLERYPGGDERARWHIVRGLEVFQKYFGFRPNGCWPSEGSVSEAALRLFGEFGFSWVATGENVYRNTLHNFGQGGAQELTTVHHAFQVKHEGPACFFRDDGLSDMVGFTYADWHADDAVANLLHHIENIYAHNKDEIQDTVVSIVLDGENAWEYYPSNGYHFLHALYQRLAEHPDIELTTFSEALAAGAAIKQLPGVTAGSWVYGTFSTWIGEVDKNRGWDMLGDLKKIYDQVLAEGRLSTEGLAKAELQMAICEGSDWFWWFGGYNPESSVSDFERLYRTHLSNMYQILGAEPPEYLSHSFTQGKGSPAAGGVMRTGS